MLELDGPTLTWPVFRDCCLRPNCPAIIRHATVEQCQRTGEEQQRSRVCFDLHVLRQQLSPHGLCATLGETHAVPTYAVPRPAPPQSFSSPQTRLGTRPVVVRRGSSSSSSSDSDASSASPLDAAAKTSHETSQQAEYYGTRNEADTRAQDCFPSCEQRTLREVFATWSNECADTAHTQPRQSYSTHINDVLDSNAAGAPVRPQDKHQPTTLPLLYLKDWHMQTDVELAMRNEQTALSSCATKSSSAGLYRVPSYLGPDWLNDFCRCVQTKARRAKDHGGCGEEGGGCCSQCGTCSSAEPRKESAHGDCFFACTNGNKDSYTCRGGNGATVTCDGCGDCRRVQRNHDSDAKSGECVAATHGSSACTCDSSSDERCNVRDANRVRVRGFGNSVSDYRFAYVGPVHTWTPLHYDVFGSYSWSLNVCGDKLWFFPTHEGNDYLLRTLPPNFPTPPDIRVLAGFEYVTVVQHPGDLVFVPSVYYHQVHNIAGSPFALPVGIGERTRAAMTPSAAVQPRQDDAQPMHRTSDTSHSSSCVVATCLDSAAERVILLTIAINHNWCNEYCVERVVALFCRDAHTLRRLLLTEDVRVVLNAHDTDTAPGGKDVDYGTYWARFDAMLHRSTNWSFAAIRSFLLHIQARHVCCDGLHLSSPPSSSSTQTLSPATTFAEQRKEARGVTLQHTQRDVTILIAKLLRCIDEVEAAILSDMARSCARSVA